MEILKVEDGQEKVREIPVPPDQAPSNVLPVEALELVALIGKKYDSGNTSLPESSWQVLHDAKMDKAVEKLGYVIEKHAYPELIMLYLTEKAMPAAWRMRLYMLEAVAKRTVSMRELRALDYTITRLYRGVTTEPE